MINFEAEITSDHRIIDFLSGKELEPHPEEFVRQKFLKILHYEYHYPKEVLATEVSIYYGNKVLIDKEGNPIRADIVVYLNKKAKESKDQGQIHFVVECKSPNEKKGYNQLVSYIFNTSASGGVWFNDSKETTNIRYFRRIVIPENQLISWTGIPRFRETWDAIGRRKKSELVRAKDIKGLLRRCHNKLHSRGVESEEEDLTMDMVRILLAKAHDEEKEGELPEFYCTPEEYNKKEGRENVAKRIYALFEEVKKLNPVVFSEHERITVGERAICDVVIELQNFKLLSDLTDSRDWDLMGHAYEEYTATYLKRKKGQFFTNRLIIDLMVACLKPKYTDIILDPAGGSGGFLTGAMRYVRKNILEGKANQIAKRRQLDYHRHRIFMIESSKRLVKVSKTAMILNGDGHTGMTQGDSLGSYENFDKTIISQCKKGTPTIILTNPPFAGTGEGKINDKNTLQRFELGKQWELKGDTIHPTKKLVTEGIPPEMLFFERGIDWLAHNGQLGIVMPKSFLDTKTYLPARSLLFKYCQLLGVIVCHKNTFQPHTGVRTCLVLLRKLKKGEKPHKNYKIFCAISRKIAQDSEGVPIYKKDKNNKETEELDHDLNEILESFNNFLEGKLKESEYHFQISRDKLGFDLRINPQAYLPKLNETLKKVTEIDNIKDWSVVALGQISPDIEIFKGPRFKSENIIVENKINYKTEAYYSPSAILQEKSESLKWMDLTKANSKQLKAIEAIRVFRGDIVITRSGTIGRVAYITNKHHNAIASDDLIRVRIKDNKLRSYIYLYLQTKYAQDQMLMNEYGAVQQHLEPEHVRDILIPLPSNWKKLSGLTNKIKKIIQLREEVYALSLDAENKLNTKFSELISESENALD